MIYNLQNMNILFFSILLGIITSCFIVFFKRNSKNVYWKSLWVCGIWFPFFLFSFLAGVANVKTNGFVAFIIAFIFLGFLIISLSEHYTILDDEFLIISSIFNKKKKINITKIISIEFSYEIGENGGAIFLIKSNSGIQDSINCFIENVDGFLDQLKSINNNINIIGSKKRNIMFIIIWLLIITTMNIYTYYEFIKYIII